MFKRNDGRSPLELRTLNIEMGYLKYPEGSCLIEAGSTRIVCSATIDNRVPHWLKDINQGWVTAEYGMLPGSTQERVVRPTMRSSGRTYELQRMIGRALRASVDLAALGQRTILIDCDVLQADGGTRTLAVTGAFCALYAASQFLLSRSFISTQPMNDIVAGVSVGVVEGEIMLDLTYEEDSRAEVDMNTFMNQKLELVEIQGTAEGRAFPCEVLQEMVEAAKKGISHIIEIQKSALRME
jgi:ribonuclease PH